MNLKEKANKLGFISKIKLVHENLKSPDMGELDKMLYYLWMCELQKWLRDNYNCFLDILPHSDGEKDGWKTQKDVFWTIEVDYYGKKFEIPYTENADFVKNFNRNYEKALEIGIFQALKLIK